MLDKILRVFSQAQRRASPSPTSVDSISHIYMGIKEQLKKSLFFVQESFKNYFLKISPNFVQEITSLKFP